MESILLSLGIDSGILLSLGSSHPKLSVMIQVVYSKQTKKLLGMLWVMRLSTLRPEFLCMTAGLEGKTLAVKNKNNNNKKETQHKSLGEMELDCNEKKE